MLIIFCPVHAAKPSKAPHHTPPPLVIGDRPSGWSSKACSSLTSAPFCATVRHSTGRRCKLLRRWAQAAWRPKSKRTQCVDSSFQRRHWTRTNCYMLAYECEIESRIKGVYIIDIDRWLATPSWLPGPKDRGLLFLHLSSLTCLGDVASPSALSATERVLNESQWPRNSPDRDASAHETQHLQRCSCLCAHAHLAEGRSMAEQRTNVRTAPTRINQVSQYWIEQCARTILSGCPSPYS